MKNLLSISLAALTLSWLGSPAQAQEPDAVAVQAQAPAAPAPAAPAAPPAVAAAPATDCCTNHDDCGSWHATAEVGAYILKPHWTKDPAFSVFTESELGPVETETTRTTDFSDATQFVPRITLGVVGPNDLGFRTSWWGFATGGNASITTTTGFAEFNSALALGLGVGSGEEPGSTISATSRLRMDVWTAEATKSFEGRAGMLLIAAGIRYAHIGQDYNVVATEGIDDPGDVQSLVSGHNFNGLGPTVALEGRVNIGRGFYFYGTTRGSLLYGTSKQNAFETESNQGAVDFLDQAFVNTRPVVPEIEIELGAGYQRNFGRLQVFAQAGVVAQDWFNVGNSSRSEAGEEQEAGGPSDDNLGLFGFSCSFGVRY